MKLIKNNFKKYKEILKIIKKYKTIAIYRHSNPDFDASGSQLGLYYWIKENFPTKSVYLKGKNNIDFTPSLYIDINDFPLNKEDNFLAIILDTGAKHRIDGEDIDNASYTIKIDHHPDVESFSDLSLVNDNLVSVSELVVDMLVYFPKRYYISQNAAKALFSGIVGDSGRFMFQDTSSHTLESAAYLMNKDINPYHDVYLPMYEKSIKNLELDKFVLNNYKITDKGVIYYYVSDEDLKMLNMRPDQIKLSLGFFSSLKESNIWLSIVEDVSKGEFKVSIRSKKYKISEVAQKYNGGGHDFASGARLFKKEEIESLIRDLDSLVK